KINLETTKHSQFYSNGYFRSNDFNGNSTVRTTSPLVRMTFPVLSRNPDNLHLSEKPQYISLLTIPRTNPSTKNTELVYFVFVTYDQNIFVPKTGYLRQNRRTSISFFFRRDKPYFRACFTCSHESIPLQLLL
ncbi:hypothetical protein GIB67_011901, partial [Kingdonia uniflora]